MSIGKWNQRNVMSIRKLNFKRCDVHQKVELSIEKPSESKYFKRKVIILKCEEILIEK